MNFTYFYKQHFHSLNEVSALEHEYDIFISSFVNTERVLSLASSLRYRDSLWLVEEDERQNLFVTGKKKLIVKANEDYLVIKKCLQELNLKDKLIAVDATGFRIPYLLFMMRVLYELDVKSIDIYYTEPKKYKYEEETIFSDCFYEVKAITGLTGLNTSETENDLMIIAAGYDHSRIIDIANSKKSAEKVLLFGFPALSPSMFQENILRAHKAESSVKGTFRNIDSNIFAPAYDPFVTAQSIQEFVDNKRVVLRKKKDNNTADFSNIYLAPLSTKPHAIGMALYYLWEKGWAKNITMLYPMCGKYHLDCSNGIARIWRYTIQFPIKEI